ncbi:replication initiation protein [Rhizobium sp.]|uniref:replication initiation protein n=1 Tax=Rhizobium sp. TaxID=391 RepID=UPI0028A9274D
MQVDEPPKRIRPRSGFQLGRHRSLVQAEDFQTALNDPRQFEAQRIAHKQPRALIERMEIVGPDRLTAADAAIHALLLANAKHDGIDREQHSIALSAVMRYAGVRHVARLRASLDRIADTLVRLPDASAISDREAAPLLIIDNAGSDSDFLHYSLPGNIKKVILKECAYALVELAPMARFHGKYTGRLYQHLSIRAGYDDGFRRDWTVSFADLMTAVGYRQSGKASRFMTDVVEPAVAEINLHVGSFSVTLDRPARACGKGRAYTQLVFRIANQPRLLSQRPGVELSSNEMAAICAPDHIHPQRELPSLRAVAVCSKQRGIAATTLSAGWRSLLDRAKSDPASVLWHESGRAITGRSLLDEVEFGVDGPFADWAAQLRCEAEVILSRLHATIERRPFVGERSKPASDDPVKAAFERRWMTIINAAAEAQEMLDGFLPGTTAKTSFTDDQIAAWLNPRGPMFAGMEHELTIQFATVRLGLAGAAALAGERLRVVLQHYVDAIRKGDLGRVVDLSERLVKVRYPDPRRRADRLRSPA